MFFLKMYSISTHAIRIAITLVIFLSILTPISLAFAQSGIGGLNDSGTESTQTEIPATPSNNISSNLQKNDVRPPPTCDSLASFFLNFLTCGGRFIAVWTGTGLVYITGWVLGVTAVLFNASLELTVHGFEANVYNNIKMAVEIVWTTFRDISNIVIIGMFTFIALSMILGIEKFNARQMVAKVLLVAVLINFSLLFTRLIIFSSNFVASQFYKAAIAGSVTADTGIDAAASFGQYSTGIAGQFANMMGVAGTVGQTSGQLNQIANSPSSGGFIALLMGLLTAVVFIAAAAAFAYAAFLLIARAILFIVLLITSSLAFASYLLPAKFTGGYGWSTWWDSLLKNAVFAPLLLMMLWATLQLGTGIREITKGGSLGGLLVNPEKSGNINALFSYLMILGMLYASIKIASSFSNKVTGFSMSAILPAQLGRIGGLLGRNSVGALSSVAASRLQRAGQNALVNQKPTRAFMLNQLSRGFKIPAKSDMNVANLFGKTMGLQGMSSAQSKLGGFKGQQERFDRSNAERAKEMTLPETEARKRAESLKEEVRATASQEEKLGQQLGALTTSITDMKKALGNDSEHAKIADLERERAGIQGMPESERGDFANKRLQAINRDIEARTGNLNQQQDRINKAEKEAVEIASRRGELQKALAGRQATIAGLEQPFQTRVAQNAPGVAMANPRNWIPGALGMTSEEKLVGKMDEIVKAIRQQENIKALATEIKSMEDQRSSTSGEQTKKIVKAINRQTEAANDNTQRPHSEAA